MAMQLGNGQPQATINMTPLIDVLLVLLIIFMVIVPTRSVGLAVRAPQDDKTLAPSPEDRRALVITVLADGGVLINRDRLNAGEWGERLKRVLASRADRTVFFTAAADMEFRMVGMAIDLAKDAGATQVGLLSPAAAADATGAAR